MSSRMPPLSRVAHGICDGCGKLRPNPVLTAQLNPALSSRSPGSSTASRLPLPGAAVGGICPICLHHRDEPDRW